MGLAIRCSECGKSYRTLDQLEELRDNESICLKCRALVEVDDWDELLASWEEEVDEADEDLDDVEMDVEVEDELEEVPGEPDQEVPGIGEEAEFEEAEEEPAEEATPPTRRPPTPGPRKLPASLEEEEEEDEEDEDEE